MSSVLFSLTGLREGPTMRVVLVSVLVGVLVLAVLLGQYVTHLNKVIHDQREYTELGCKGWYQGEE